MRRIAVLVFHISTACGLHFTTLYVFWSLLWLNAVILMSLVNVGINVF